MCNGIGSAKPFLIALLLLPLTVCVPAAADESDQYMVWGRELNDAAPAINKFINDRVAAVVALVNRDNPECSCETLTAGILTDIYQDRLRADLPVYIESTYAIDVYPPRNIEIADIIGQSIYRRAITGLTIRVTRNIRIGDVYLSTDKLNHFFGIGRRYYARYRSFLLEGQTHEEAEKNATLWGIMTENTFLGTTTNGIFSIADLEANYQGLRFAQDLCAGSNPLLDRDDGRWIQKRPIDLAAYMSPYFDETFLPPLYGDLIRRAIHLNIERDYAPHAHDARVVERFAKYRTLAPPPSRSMQIVIDYLREHQIPSQRPALLAALGLNETDPTAPWDPYSAETRENER